MIKFFRKIRQSLLAEGKFAQYLKYAIGEIVLVVIGILIALSINNWNETRKDREKEQVLLQRLKEEYTSNLDQLDRKIEMRNRLISASFKIMSFIDNPDGISSDSVLKYIGPTGYGPTFDPITNDLISAGKLSLIQNEKLKRLLSAWTSEVVQLTEEEQSWIRVRASPRLPVLVRHRIVRDLVDKSWAGNKLDIIFIDQENARKDLGTIEVGKSKQEIDFTSILSDPEFEQIIALGISLNLACNVQSSSLRKRIVEILSEIDKSLE